MTDLTLAVGDRVVYPNQGLCTVTDIKTEEIAGQRLTFVSLVFAETGAKVKVPKEKLAKNGVRRVSTSDDVKAVFDFLKADGDRASLDWKKRARDNTARMSEGGLVGLAEVVKGLQELSELRPLPPKERGQYNDARHLFVEELAAALGIPEADAEDRCDICLFPVGKDRPKRTVEEFAGLGEERRAGAGRRSDRHRRRRRDRVVGGRGEKPKRRRRPRATRRARTAPKKKAGKKPEPRREAEGRGEAAEGQEDRDVRRRGHRCR